MGGPKIFPSLQTVPWSEELWFEGDCLVSVDLFFQRDWGHIEERYGIGKDCWAQRGVSQVQQWAVLNLGPVTLPFALALTFAFASMLTVRSCPVWLIISLVGEQLPRLMETLASCNFSLFFLRHKHWAIVVSPLVQFDSLLPR